MFVADFSVTPLIFPFVVCTMRSSEMTARTTEGSSAAATSTDAARYSSRLVPSGSPRRLPGRRRGRGRRRAGWCCCRGEEEDGEGARGEAGLATEGES